jgi:hypothetical protein
MSLIVWLIKNKKRDKRELIPFYQETFLTTLMDKSVI